MYFWRFQTPRVILLLRGRNILDLNKSRKKNVQITHLKFNTTTFKAINLPPEEKQQSDDLLKSLEGADGFQADLFKIKLYRLFDKHLQREVDLKSRNNYIKADFSQKILLVFFETLENIRNRTTSISELLPIINKARNKNEDL